MLVNMPGFQTETLPKLDGFGQIRMMSISRLLAALAVLTALVSLPAPALAWGELGHRVVADLAYQHLKPTAKARVDAILAARAVREPGCGIVTFADAAAFPECVKGVGKYRRYARLHIDNISICEPRPDYCKNGECASGAAKRALATLRNPLSTPEQQGLALAEAAHFIGDLHEPMNTADNRDSQGEKLRVSLPGSANKDLNLHDVWEEQLVAVAVGSEELGARYLRPIADAHQEEWSLGDPDSWTAETHNVAKAFAYARLPMAPVCGKRYVNNQGLDRVYIIDATAVVRDQLARAAVRLAAAMNSAFP